MMAPWIYEITFSALTKIKCLFSFRLQHATVEYFLALTAYLKYSYEFMLNENKAYQLDIPCFISI